MKRMETVPRELNLVKKVADFKLISGNTMRTRKRGTCKKLITNKLFDDDDDDEDDDADDDDGDEDDEDDDDDDERHRGELAPDEVERGGVGFIWSGRSTETISLLLLLLLFFHSVGEGRSAVTI